MTCIANMVTRLNWCFYTVTQVQLNAAGLQDSTIHNLQRLKDAKAAVSATISTLSLEQLPLGLPMPQHITSFDTKYS